MGWDIEFYKKENGRIPVIDFLKQLPSKLRAKAYSEIELLEEHGTKLKEPYVKPIQGKEYKGIYELRVKLGSDNTRIFYFTFEGDTFVLLHGFLKKTDKTPISELKTAKRYMDDFLRRCKDV